MTRKKNSEWIVKTDLTTASLESQEIVKMLLSSRGIQESEYDSFLEPSFDSFPWIYDLFDAGSAAKRILKAIESKKKIFIHGDFDADGICATTILWEFLYREVPRKTKIKPDVLPFIPNRKDDGYGLSESTIEQLIAQDVDMIITVDCGIRDTELIKKYPDIEFVITDHHQPGEDLKVPKEICLVHPMYPGHEYVQTSISGTHVAFLLIQALKKELGMGFTIDSDTSGLDLVALSTVTDIMPLNGLNRVAVHYGLDQIRNSTRPGLIALMQLADVAPSTLNSYHLGFVLGPRINAAGRIGDPMDGVRLLSSRDRVKARELANRINQLNTERQKVTETVLTEAIEQVDVSSKIIIVKGKDWPEGIVGLVAGKLMEKYNKPTLVMSEKEELRGSARSLGGFNITKALESLSGHLLRYGGHAEAAGFSLEVGKYEKFKSELIDIADRELSGVDLVPESRIDAKITVDMASIQLALELNKLEPYGHKNPKPKFMIENALISKKIVMGSGRNHMKLSIKGTRDKRLDAVIFDCIEDISEIKEGDRISLVGYLGINEWNGTASIQLMVSEWDM